MSIAGNRFSIKDSNIFTIPGNPHMLHIVTIGYGLREFVLMVNRNNSKMYIEEVVLQTVDFKEDVWANFKFIDDNNLAFEISSYCEELGYRDMRKIAEKCIDMGRPEWTRPHI